MYPLCHLTMSFMFHSGGDRIALWQASSTFSLKTAGKCISGQKKNLGERVMYHQSGIFIHVAKQGGHRNNMILHNQSNLLHLETKKTAKGMQDITKIKIC